jgi:hypothetical protein
MLRFLRGKAGDRKLRLFAVACCRCIWGILPDERSRHALAVAEAFADGATGEDRLHAAWLAATEVSDTSQGSVWQRTAARAAEAAAAGRPEDAAAEASRRSGVAAALASPQHSVVSRQRRERHASLLHCVVGNPFRPAPALDPSWAAWNGGTVAKLAAAIYDGRRFADLPILADALEDAGCADAAILAHCRGGGEHVRGCWVVDLLTGRE